MTEAQLTPDGAEAARTQPSDRTATTRLNIGVEDFLQIAMGHSRALMFADTNHSVVPQRLDSLLSSPQLLAKFSENGYHAYFRETGAQSQPIITDLASGRLNASKFSEKMLEAKGGYLDVPTTHISDPAAKAVYLETSLAPLISQLSKFGITTIPADVEMETYVDEFDYLMEQASPAQREMFERRDLTSADLDASLKLLRGIVYPDGVIPEYIRLSKDPLVADHILERTRQSGSEKVFGMYGAGHSFHKDAIPNHIEGMTTILAMDSMSSYNLIKTKFQERSREAAETSTKFPGFVFDTETGTIYSTPNADPALLKKLNAFTQDKSATMDMTLQRENRPKAASPTSLAPPLPASPAAMSAH